MENTDPLISEVETDDDSKRIYWHLPGQCSYGFGTKSCQA